MRKFFEVLATVVNITAIVILMVALVIFAGGL